VGGPEHYDHSAVEVVIQLLDHVTPLIENIRLIDTLASYSAEEERRRIARDIHDSVIQPYIGLQLGIAAVAQKLRAGNMDVINDVEELSDLTNQELAALRGYVWGLRAGEERRDVLMPAIERFVSRFSTVTGISVSVSAKGKIEVNDRLAAEIFHMVTEGLSNVRRHGLCNDASVELACHQGKFLLRIKNPRPSLNGNGNGQPNHSYDKQLFTPRSISERASLLGGQTEVSIDEKNRTVVQVAIPL
jgi:signal transduction histidine kinase